MSDETQSGDGQASAPKYPLGVPGKFDPSGNVRPFPGNTIVCHLSPTSNFYSSLLILYEGLRTSSLSHLIALLPPPSWHMTVFEGVCDRVRLEAYWTKDLPLDASLEDVTALFAQRLASFDLKCEPKFEMMLVGWDPLQIGIGATLAPRTPEEGARLRELRNRLSDCLGVRHPVHDNYSLHLSMAYLLRHLTEEQKNELRAILQGHFEKYPVEFELGAPEFCVFDDMFAFKRQFYLKNRVD
jgi:hypothetical protein